MRKALEKADNSEYIFATVSVKIRCRPYVDFQIAGENRDRRLTKSDMLLA
jgi:hypothetical protein